MITGEEAQRRLEQYRRPGRGRLRDLADQARLSADARTVHAWLHTWQVGATPRETGRVLLGMSDRERGRLFSVLSPALADSLGRWWAGATGQAYQVGWGRRGFRSPRLDDSGERLAHELRDLARLCEAYDQPVEWWARWHSHLSHGQLASLFAAEVDASNTRVTHLLRAAATGDDEVARMSADVVGGLARSADPASWRVLDGLLRAAGRQEGLRQSILEGVDLAHPGARLLLVQTVVDSGYTRFASAIRAVGTWWGEELEVRQDKQVLAHLTTWLPMLAEPPLGRDLGGLEPFEAYLALQAIALHDVHAGLEAARRLLASGSADHRLAAVRLLGEADLPESHALAMTALSDDDPRVLAVAVEACVPHTWEGWESLSVEAARALVPLLDDLPARNRKLATGLVGKRESTLGRAHVADALLRAAGEDVADLVEPAHAVASADGRGARLRRLSADPVRHRAALMESLTDLSSWNRGQAAKALADVGEISAEEALPLEAALSRKAADQRTIALRFLARQSPAALSASVQRLRAGTADQQRAADELDPTDAPDPGTPALPTGPLLVRASDRTPPERPERPGFAEAHPDVAARVQLLVDSLDEHLTRSARTEVVVHQEPVLLESLRWVPWPHEGEMPLPEVLVPWWEEVSPQLTDGGLEALLLADFHSGRDDAWAEQRSRLVIGKVRWPRAFRRGRGEHAADPIGPQVVSAVAQAQLRASWARPYLDAAREVSTTLDTAWLCRPVAVHAARGEKVPTSRWGGRSDHDARDLLGGLGPDRWHELHRRGLLPADLLPAVWRHLRWLDEPAGTWDPVDGAWVEATQHEASFYDWNDEGRIPGAPVRHRAPSRIVLDAYAAGAATRTDLVDVVLGGSYRGDDLLQLGTRRRPPEWLVRSADALEVVHEVRDAVVDAELARGDLPTLTSGAARRITSVRGAGRLRELLDALGKRPFTRGYAWTDSRESSLSRLIRSSWPADGETDADADAALQGVPEKRLVELAVYAPQWAGHVERVLDRPGLESGVWWLHAHTKDDSWTVSQEVREEWAAEVARHTPLEADDLVRGAIDVHWAGQMLLELGDDHFDGLLAASKYASSAGGHKRAELFARAVRGQVSEDDLRERIDAKRHQDSVRALGLLPVPDEATVLRRYEFLRGWVASDRSSGSQRRTSETVAAEVALDNLARSAGHRDPQRLVWAMEAQAVADLAAGPVSATDGDLTVTLSLDEEGRPVLDVRRGDKALKSVPAATLKRAPEVAALRSRVTALRKQASRMRASLEQACVRGETFTPGEYADLLRHPMLAPLLRDLVMVSEEGVIGFGGEPDHLVGADGAPVPLDGSALRVAHPVDLLASGVWPELQHRLFDDRRTQAFKQAFRELYTPTEAERSVVDKSRRFAGHQVQARQAGGLFRTRGWVSDFEVGFAKTFHAERITALCSLLDGWGSPTEVEDATIEDVWFLRRGQPLPLTEVPPRLFSEVMRDLDLVVSVAHSGGVDPETSESAVEVRRRLVQETAEMLSLGNVEVAGHHARIEGRLGSYSVQLGSGTVHRLPGGAVCIVPVSAQHRGRVFLPFADDDPRTAEVVSKVVLLARDHTIKDPTILAQLR